MLAHHAFQYTCKEVVISAADFDGRDFETVNCVRGYHIYKTIWSPTTGCEQEEAIPEDPYAVAIVAEGVTVGHVPRRISAACSLFLQRLGWITHTILKVSFKDDWNCHISALSGGRSCLQSRSLKSSHQKTISKHQ